jgi:hypothetical protein
LSHNYYQGGGGQRLYKYSVGFRSLFLIAAYNPWIMYNTYGTTLILYGCMYVCLYICMYVCMYACMYVCMKNIGLVQGIHMTADSATTSLITVIK